MYHIGSGKQKKDFLKCMRKASKAKRLPHKYIFKYYILRTIGILNGIRYEFADALHELRTVSKSAIVLTAVGVVITALSFNLCVLNTRVDNLSAEKTQLTNELSDTKAELEKNMEALEGSFETNKLEVASKDVLIAEKDDIIAEKDKIIEDQQSAIDSIEAEKEEIIKDFIEQIENLDIAGSGSTSRSSSELNSAMGNIAETEMLIRDALGYTDEANELVGRLEAKIDELQDVADRFPDYYPTVGMQTSYFGYRRDPITGETRYHSGNDIANSSGTPIWAAGKGVVISAGYNGDYGNEILIDHGNGIVTRYAHLSQIQVSAGEVVQKGEQIALMGATGRVTGPHLHFEVLIGGERVNPDDYVGG